MASVAVSSVPESVAPAGLAVQEAAEQAPACAIQPSADDHAAQEPQAQTTGAENGASRAVDKDAVIRKIMPVTRKPRSAGVTRSDVNASCGCNGNGSKSYVYVIGTLGYDFGTEANRDGFQSLMPAINPDGSPAYPGNPPPGAFQPYPANPYDARQMVNYLQGWPAPIPPYPIQAGFPTIVPPPMPAQPAFPLQASMWDASQLIWTFNIDLTPIYAIQPAGSFSTEVYQLLVQTLACQVLPPKDPGLVTHFSLGGVLTGKTVQLYSGQIVPVVIPQLRGIASWSDNGLIDFVLEQMTPKPDPKTADKIRFGLQMFIDKIYYELRNVGQTSAERALNYSGVNLFQASDIFMEQASQNWQLDSIVVTRSPFCRIDSDCWDVTLKFMNPDNLLYARKVYSYTVDVSVEYPVLVGPRRNYFSTN